MRVLLLFALAAACGGDPWVRHGDDVVDSTRAPECGLCSPDSQTGCNFDEKCTWVIDEVMPQYVGHISCVPSGSVEIGSACGWALRSGRPECGVPLADDCVRGAVCDSAGGGSGTCKAICDNQGGNPMCDSMHGCVVDPLLFSTGATSPHAAGLCEPACDPLADNDFDGSGSALTRSGSACGSAAYVGCYGVPSFGIPPKTMFTCMPERHYDTPLRHRTECTMATGCVDDGNIYVNSCNQGYLPLFRESTAVSTAVCVAMCAPLDCYAGNCGSNNINRLGAAPHRCTTPDAVGNFGSGEECQYLWAHELDGSGNWLPSPHSDTVGLCFDHSKYGLPACEDLPLHGSGSGYDAVSLGCVSSQTAGLP